MPNDLGIVVIGRNEGQRLINCLKSVKSQADTAIVYVDSGSTDGSVAAAQQLGVTVVNLDFVGRSPPRVPEMRALPLSLR